MWRPEITIDDAPALASGPLVLDIIEQCLGEQGRCRIALSGGSTPQPLFEWLRDHLPEAYYPALAITWADERILPTTDAGPALADEGMPRWSAWHPDTNLHLAWRHWLQHVSVLPGDVLSMHGIDPEDARAQFTPAFLDRFDGAIDLALLGAGPDGHIASLFPDHEALEVEGCAVAVTDSPKPPAGRLSLTLGVLAEARHRVVVARGADKATVFAQALDGELPLGALLREATGSTRWVVDPAVARDL
ncbi:MAG: 6-phosphogluconolactonase [Bradymonadia bacterium]